MDDGFAFSAGGTYAGTDFRAGRTITAPGLGQTLQTDASGNVGQLFGEIAYDLAAGANARVEPFARLGWVSLSSDAYSEAGGYAALVGEKGTYDTTFTTLGVRGVYNLSGSVEGASLRGSAGWMHTSGDRSPEAIVAITGTNSPASIYGVAFDEDAASLEAGVDYSFGAFRVGVGYVGVIGKNTKDNGVTATMTWGF
jgi:outer membrane autotransporter protein